MENQVGVPPKLFQSMLSCLTVLFRLEKPIFGLIISYSLVIGLFSLIVPLTVQELVNTFAFAIQPITILTLITIMVLGLLFVGTFRVLQFYAVEILEGRLFARTALAVTHQVPYLKFSGFDPRYANYFIETDFMQRALAVLLVDLINFIVSGTVGMTILIVYHPYFLLFNTVLLGGFGIVFFLLSHGGVSATIMLSHAKYKTLDWIQEVSRNLLHFKSTDSQALLMEKTDELVHAYVRARETRFKILLNQYIGSVSWQAIAHGGLLGTAGWLLSIGQLTLGQLVAAEVVVSGLLLGFDTVIKRMGHVYHFLTGVNELNVLLSLPQDSRTVAQSLTLPDPTIHGIHLSGKNLGIAQPEMSPVFKGFNLEVAPGEKVGIYAGTLIVKKELARILAGIEMPTNGILRYNGIDLRNLDLQTINRCRGFLVDSPLALFDETIEHNITMGRSYLPTSDIRWAIRFVELEETIHTFPLGLNTRAHDPERFLTPEDILKVLLARAILARPKILIFDGILHALPSTTRETILQRLCSKDETWSVIFVSNDPDLTPYIDRKIILD